MNTINKPKFGRGGRRNRQRRARMIKRGNTVGYTGFLKTLAGLGQKLVSDKVDLSVTWNADIAKTAFNLWSNSGKTQKEFAEENGFPVSRFRSWKSKIAA